jgi:hypothetical protein
MEHLRTVVHSHLPSCCLGVLPDADSMFPAQAPEGIQSSQSPIALSPGTSITPAHGGIELVIFYPKNSSYVGVEFMRGFSRAGGWGRVFYNRAQ